MNHHEPLANTPCFTLAICQDAEEQKNSTLVAFQASAARRQNVIVRYGRVWRYLRRPTRAYKCLPITSTQPAHASTKNPAHSLPVFFRFLQDPSAALKIPLQSRCDVCRGSLQRPPLLKALDSRALMKTLKIPSAPSLCPQCFARVSWSPSGVDFFACWPSNCKRQN